MRSKPFLSEYSEEELLAMPKAKAQAGLTEKQVKFCEIYVEGHNKKMAALKAGYRSTFVSSAAVVQLLRNEKVCRYINWLKARILKEHFINAADVLDEWIRIAFSDITDFVEINPHSIKLKKNEEIDGQLVKSIKSGREGVSIELHDKMKALDNLAKYIQDMPSDFKQKLEERKLELMEQEFEFKKKVYEQTMPVFEDDGFIEAIKESAQSVWESDEKE